ncbi:hypothetical protein CFP56_035089 [Quercus suber]|uniref:Uncharacterized protein n=1 Tax=Quercus suber TaxID=58331 RepID=A0AAW0JAH8_QUESU
MVNGRYRLEHTGILTGAYWFGDWYKIFDNTGQYSTILMTSEERPWRGLCFSWFGCSSASASSSANALLTERLTATSSQLFASHSSSSSSSSIPFSSTASEISDFSSTSIDSSSTLSESTLSILARTS